MRRTGLDGLQAAGQGVAGFLALGLAAAGCADDAGKLNPVREPLRIITGLPAVEQAPARIDRAPGEVAPGDLQAKRSTHCDSFGQPPAGKVDVLWIVRRAPSMDAPLERLASVMEAFIGVLGSAPAPDFHLGFVASDLQDDGGAGALHAAPGDPSFLACAPSDGTLRCNVGGGSVAEALGWIGRSLRALPAVAAPEKGLLAASRAVSAELAAGANAGFVRPDAQLRLVFFSNEDDVSCFPYASQADAAAGCTSAGVCGCAAAPSFGAVPYFSRLFEGAKGFGNSAFVSADAIVTTSTEPLDWQDGSGFTYVGCTASPGAPCAVSADGGAFCALHAPRYAAIATATGGRVFDPCARDLGSALQEVGAGASGLSREFRLSRVPIEATIET
ncbi:MAG TPA: hypothetical protein VGD74_02640, partial [Vulgatibacter sp.]